MNKANVKIWTEDELAYLYAMREDGISYNVIASELKRSVNACEKKYRGTRWDLTPFYDETRKGMQVSRKKALAEKILNAHNKKIESEKFKTDIIADKIAEAVAAYPVVNKAVYRPTKQGKISSNEDVGLIFSDCHIGHHHTFEETGGLSEYNLEVFNKRVNNLKQATSEIVELHSKLYKLPTLHFFCLGDIVAGMNRSGSWSPTYINMPIYDQMIGGFEAISDMIYYWLGLFDNINFYGVMGNHGRCLTDDTKILTPNGYKGYLELKEGDLVGTVNENETFEFQPIRKMHFYPKEPSVVGVSDSKFEMFVTKDHSVIHHSRKTDKLMKSKASNLMGKGETDYKIPLSFPSGNIEHPISDDMIALFGWIMTDGGYSRDGNGAIIYQSKENQVNYIRDLLGRLKIKYTEKTRKRENIIITGVKVKRTLVSHEFHISSKEDLSNIRNLLPNRESIPEWMYKLSDRQVSILLDAIVSGDGSSRETKKRKYGYNRSGGRDVVWGNVEFLEQLSGLLISHNIPCSINTHKRKDVKLLKNGDTQKINSYLQIKKSNHYWLTSEKMKEVDYGRMAWCVTVDNGTIAVKGSKGDIYYTGNCAPQGFEKEYVNWDYLCYQFIEARFKDNPRVKFNCPKTWWIMTKIRNHKFLLVHGEDVRGGSMPIKGLMNYEQKMLGVVKEIPDYTLAGHFHSAAELTTNHGKLIINGSFLGPDMYSLKNLQAGGRPEQKIFGIHDKRGITWSYNLDLDKR